ncbi:Abhydrolase_6 domain-containing protein [Gossypium australe]|uniref:Abhydrolase_6 domain-containing protein n=1 Tax=Gossypium australe TaxID=47621 RepID=A0A5B6W2S9_9ROSI|nr:Abhydrolase_6 domain-containing protein [Gossypium australe]
MGNCFARKTVTKRPVTKRLQNQQKGPNSSNRWARVRSSRKDKLDDSLLQEQALAAAILFRQHQQQNGGASLPFDRSASLRYPNSSSGSKKAGQLPRSSSSNDLMRQAQIFLYANGNDHPPTAIDLDKSLLRDLLFNQSPSKDVALASVSMRPIPFAPVLEKLSLSDMKYGSVRRFYVETPEDNAIPVVLQESMINSSPPEKVFRLKGADHSPFFSKPQALHKLFVEISKLPSP